MHNIEMHNIYGKRNIHKLRTLSQVSIASTSVRYVTLVLFTSHNEIH